MTVLSDVLSFRPGFLLAALTVTCVAIILLGLIVVNLHVRLQRLEQQTITSRPDRPYGRFVGTRLRELVGNDVVPAETQVIIFMASPDCPACRRVIGELQTRAVKVPCAVVWTRAHPSVADAGLPEDIVVIEPGRNLAERLAIRVTPFAIISDTNGITIHATPFSRLSSILEYTNLPARDMRSALRPRYDLLAQEALS